MMGCAGGARTKGRGGMGGVGGARGAGERGAAEGEGGE